MKNRYLENVSNNDVYIALFDIDCYENIGQINLMKNHLYWINPGNIDFDNFFEEEHGCIILRFQNNRKIYLNYHQANRLRSAYASGILNLLCDIELIVPTVRLMGSFAYQDKELVINFSEILYFSIHHSNVFQLVTKSKGNHYVEESTISHIRSIVNKFYNNLPTDF